MRCIGGLKVLGSIAFAAAAASTSALAAGWFGTTLSGFEEVPSISTPGSGSFLARQDGDVIRWQMSYQDLDGQVTQAHIHFAQAGVNGGVAVFLCTNLGNAPSGVTVQACPTPPATLTGSFGAADVVGPGAQGLQAGDLAALLAAMQVGATYVNVHSSLYPAGEIRGQIAFPGGRGAANR